LEEGHRVRLLSELSVDTTLVRPTRVIGDPAMLKRMIRNVVDNATRYATEQLRFDSHYDGKYAVVTVADDGEGIDVEPRAVGSSRRFIRSDPARARSPAGPVSVWRSCRDRRTTRRLGALRGDRAGTMIELRVRRDGRVVAVANQRWHRRA
jgi:hypothetical protein